MTQVLDGSTGDGDVTRRLDWLISVDDHVLEPPGVWQERLPAALRDAGPRLADDGTAWLYEGSRFPVLGTTAAVGRSKEDCSPAPVSYHDMEPGCYDVTARLEAMDRDHVLASLCFPSFPRFCGQTFFEGTDHELGMACVRAYNDWMLEEWCATAPGRFIPMVLIPLWDPAAAAAEIERTAALGAKAIAFSENPSPLGLPSIHDRDGFWEPVFAAASDTQMPLCTHLGSSSQLPEPSPDSPLISRMVLTPLNLAVTCSEWMFSGVFQRHPNLRLCLSEGGIGWIPFLVERADFVFDRHQWTSTANFQLDPVTGTLSAEARDAPVELRRPSQVFRDHVFGCFIDDIHGSNNLEAIGVDNVMIETDYPHLDTTWPHSLEMAHKRLSGSPEDVQYQVLRGNAERVFRFAPSEPPT